MKTEITFKDSKGFRVTAEITIKDDNTFTMSGDYNNGLGQVFDRVEPKTESQEELIKFWTAHHLKTISKAAKLELEAITEDLETEAEEARSEIIDLDEIRGGELDWQDADKEVKRLMNLIVGDVDEDEFEALINMFDLTENDLGDVVIERDNRICVMGTDYLFGTDSEMDTIWDDYLESYCDEHVLSRLDESLQCYFNVDQWVGDAKMDGRGHSLNYYDGGELEHGDYYAYRQ